jgi:MFS family permease
MMKKEEINKEHPIIEKKVDRSLDLCLREGAVHSISAGFGYSYLSPFAILMNATPSQVGILYAVTNLVPGISQIRASKLLEKMSPKKVSVVGTVSQAFLWIILILTGIAFYYDVPGAVWVLIFLSGAIYFFLGIVQPAWFAWIGLLVHERSRGKYFSKRNAVVGIFGILSMILAATILDNTQRIGEKRGDVLLFVIIGFSVIFLVSSITKLWCANYMRKMYQPKTIIRKKDYFSFWQFIKRSPKTPFGKYVIFRTFFSIAIGIAVPFFTLYLLRDLNLSYLWYISIIASGTFFQLIFLPVLGKVSDIYGNVRLTKISAGLIFLIPFLWYLTDFFANPFHQKVYLLLVPQIVSGFAWAGYNLSTNNYVYDSVTPNKRAFGASYMNLLIGASLFAGAILGSLIIKYTSFMNPILFVFLVSSGARLLIFLIGMKHLQEVRPVENFSHRFLLKEFHPIQDLAKNVSYIEHFVRKDKI